LAEVVLVVVSQFLYVFAELQLADLLEQEVAVDGVVFELFGAGFALPHGSVERL
jgi:hypothetical protein